MIIPINIGVSLEYEFHIDFVVKLDWINLGFSILFVGKNKFDEFGFVFLILIVGKGKFVVRIYTIKSYETMTHRCRGHH